MQQTLLCLSKLYRCVEPKVFAGLAQDAVSSCALAVQVCGSCPPRAAKSGHMCRRLTALVMHQHHPSPPRLQHSTPLPVAPLAITPNCSWCMHIYLIVLITQAMQGAF